MRTYILPISMALCFMVQFLAQISATNWPSENGQAILSDKYNTYIKIDSGQKHKLEIGKSLTYGIEDHLDIIIIDTPNLLPSNIIQT